MHIERIYVHRSLADEFTRRFVEAAEEIKLGATYDFEPEMGSLVSETQRDRVIVAHRGCGRQGRHGAHRRAGPP